MKATPNRASARYSVNVSGNSSNNNIVIGNPKLRSIIDVDQFKTVDFSSNQFIDNLTKGLVGEQAIGADFDAALFKKLVDDSLEFLQQHSVETDSEIQSIVEQCEAADRMFQMQMGDLTQNFETNFSKFSKLDARINRVSSSAARIGDRLEVVDAQQKRADDAMACIKYFMELNNSFSAKRSAVFTDESRVHELARLLKKLSGVAQELDLQSMTKGKEATEILSNNIENELLQQFEKAAKMKDFETMKESANTLVDFNGGDSCIQRYIATRDMFISEESIMKDETLAKDSSKQRIMGDVIIDTRIDEFYEDIVQAVQEEDQIIAKVFPSPPVVMSGLIQRIFEQRVRTFLENMLLEEKNNNLLLYLRTLCMALEKTRNNLVPALQKYWSAGKDFGSLINSVFCNYQDEYISLEMSVMSLFFGNTLIQIRSSATEQDKTDIGDVLGVVTTFLTTTEDAVARARVLSLDDVVAENIARQFNITIKFLGLDYLENLLEKACRLPSPTDLKFLAALQYFFAQVQTVTSSVLLIQRHFQLVTLPLISGSVNEYTQCYEVLQDFMARLESKISTGMSVVMQSMTVCIDKMLVEQKKDDFKFKDEATEYSSEPSKACQTVTKFIRNIYDTVIGSLDGRNVDIFFEELGSQIYKMLMTHFKKFKIGMGGLRLMRDLAEYKDALKLFQIPSIDESCVTLSEISKLYLIAPENIKSVVEEGVLSRMDKNELLTFVKLRSDYKSAWIGKYV